MPSHVIASLRYDDAPAMIDWLCRALGFTRHAVFPNPDGSIAHAQLTFGDGGMIMLGSASNQGEIADQFIQPSACGGRNTQSCYLVSPETAALCEQAVTAGAQLVMPLRTMDYGGLAFTIRDPEEHLWAVGEYDPWAGSAAEHAPARRATVRPMEEHPYRKNIAGLDPVAVLSETPRRLRELLGPLSPEEIDRSPGPGKWSLRELMAHLADCEVAWAWRLRQLLSGAPDLQSFDQDRWADRYAPCTFPQSQAAYEALRAWNLTLLSTLQPADRDLPAHHPEYGDMTLQHVLEIIAGHDVHHVRLLESKFHKQERQAVPSPS